MDPDWGRSSRWETFEEELLPLFADTGNEAIARNIRLLSDLAVRYGKGGDGHRLCLELATTMQEAIERWDPAKVRQDWRSSTIDPKLLLPPVAQAFVVRIRRALCGMLPGWRLQGVGSFTKKTSTANFRLGPLPPLSISTVLM